MGDTHRKGLNADSVWNDLENCCRGEALCVQCQGESCIIVYQELSERAPKGGPRRHGACPCHGL